jgi:hypothetical protein
VLDLDTIEDVPLAVAEDRRPEQVVDTYPGVQRLEIAPDRDEDDLFGAIGMNLAAHLAEDETLGLPGARHRGAGLLVEGLHFLERNGPPEKSDYQDLPQNVVHSTPSGFSKQAEAGSTTGAYQSGAAAHGAAYSRLTFVANSPKTALPGSHRQLEGSDKEMAHVTRPNRSAAALLSVAVLAGMVVVGCSRPGGDAPPAVTPSPAPTASVATLPVDETPSLARGADVQSPGPTAAPASQSAPAAASSRPNATADPLDSELQGVSQLLNGIDTSISGSDSSTSGGE